jgi:hypothetical protein
LVRDVHVQQRRRRQAAYPPTHPPTFEHDTERLVVDHGQTVDRECHVLHGVVERDGFADLVARRQVVLRELGQLAAVVEEDEL